MKQKTAVIGGDARYIELIRQIQKNPDTTIDLVGFGSLEQGFIGCNQVEFEELKPEEIDAVILPITGTDEKGNVEPVFSSETIQLSKEWFARLNKSAVVFTGIANKYLKETAEEANIELISLLNRDDIAIYNSIPTAEGAIMMAIEHTDHTIHSSHITVTGFGRVGHTLANKLHALGAQVTVGSNNLRELARAKEIGMEAYPLDQLPEKVEHCDLMMNTIPAPVIDRTVIEKLPSQCVILDLASKPGGTDFQFAKRRGIRAILAKSLPNVVAPKTAGKILADVIQKIMKGES